MIEILKWLAGKVLTILHIFTGGELFFWKNQNSACIGEELLAYFA